jgi:hypothetical protein
MLAARWEAFRAEPFPRRLLDLRDAAGDRKAQDHWMLQVVTRACDQTAGLIPGPFVDGGTGGDQVLFLGDGDQFTSGPANATTACALMLAGSWRQALKMDHDDEFFDWADDTTPRTFVLPVMMAWLVGWPERPMPASTAALLEAALDTGSMRTSRTGFASVAVKCWGFVRSHREEIDRQIEANEAD